MKKSNFYILSIIDKRGSIGKEIYTEEELNKFNETGSCSVCQQALAMVKFFNNTLRPGESPRTLYKIENCQLEVIDSFLVDRVDVEENTGTSKESIRFKSLTV